MNIFHPALLATAHNLRREIHFVVRRADAGAQLHGQILRSGAESLHHEINRTPDNIEFAPFLSRVHEANPVAHGVDQINGATIRDIDAEARLGLSRKEPVTPFETLVGRGHAIDDPHFVAMHLLDGEKGSCADSKIGADCAVNRIEPTQRLLFIRTHIDPRDARDEAVDEARQSRESRKLLDWERTIRRSHGQSQAVA